MFWTIVSDIDEDSRICARRKRVTMKSGSASGCELGFNSRRLEYGKLPRKMQNPFPRTKIVEKYPGEASSAGEPKIVLEEIIRNRKAYRPGELFEGFSANLETFYNSLNLWDKR